MSVARLASLTTEDLLLLWPDEVWPQANAALAILDGSGLPLIANVCLGVGALSYAGEFNLSAIADRDAYPDLDAAPGRSRWRPPDLRRWW